MNAPFMFSSTASNVNGCRQATIVHDKNKTVILAMTVHFFIEDESNPVVYDYDLSAAGALTVSPMFLHRAEDVTLVVLKKADHGPTAAQLQRIAAMRAEYPDVDMRFHFCRKRPAAPAAPANRGTPLPISAMGERIAGIIRRALPI